MVLGSGTRRRRRGQWTTIKYTLFFHLFLLGVLVVPEFRFRFRF